MRYKGRVDDNQTNIVQKFKGAGYSVAITSNLGNGFPDIVVGKCGINLLIEIKDGDKPPSRRKLTEDELRWHTAWRGTVLIVENEQDVEEIDQWLKDTFPNLNQFTDSL